MMTTFKVSLLAAAGLILAGLAGCSSTAPTNLAPNCDPTILNCDSFNNANTQLTPVPPSFSRASNLNNAGYPVNNSAAIPSDNVGLIAPIVLSGDDVFAAGKAELSAVALSRLDAVAQTLKSNPNGKYDIVGHTDSRGDASSNQQLSEKRAQSVANYLYSRGLPFGSLNIIGAGETQLLDLGSSDSAHAKNRRVEIRNSMNAAAAGTNVYSFQPVPGQIVANQPNPSAANPYGAPAQPNVTQPYGSNPYGGYGNANTATGYGDYGQTQQPAYGTIPSIPAGNL